MLVAGRVMGGLEGLAETKNKLRNTRTGGA